MLMPGRQYNPANYRFGFNKGSEKDDEIYGTGNAYTAKFWEYDPRLGRRWNVDPIFKANISSYACYNDNPITNVDPDGQDPKKGDKSNTGKSEERKARRLQKLENKVEKQLAKEGKTEPQGMPHKAYVLDQASKIYPNQAKKLGLATTTQSKTTGWNRTSTIQKGTDKTITSTLASNIAPTSGSGDAINKYTLPPNATAIDVTGDNYSVPDKVSVNQVNTTNGATTNLFDMGAFKSGTYDTGNLPTAPENGNQVSVRVNSSDGDNSLWTYSISVTQTIPANPNTPNTYPIIDYTPR